MFAMLFKIFLFLVKSFFKGCVLFGCYLLTCAIHSHYFHPLRFVPGPFLASISRLWIVAIAHEEDMEQFQRELHKQYGPLVRIAPNEVICSDPKAIEIIYGAGSGFTKTDFYDSWAAPSKVGHPGHFVKRNTEQRRILEDLYSTSSVLDYERTIDERTRDFACAVTRPPGQVCNTNLGVLLQSHVFSTLGHILYGPEFLLIALPIIPFLVTIDYLLPIHIFNGLLPSYLRKYHMRYDTSTYRSFSPILRPAMLAMRIMQISLWALVELRHLEPTTETSNGPDIRRKLFSMVDHTQDTAKFTLDEVSVELQAALSAGTNPTSIAITAVLYHLTCSPHAYKKLVREIDAAFRDGKLSPMISYQEASTTLPYLRACITEAMRLHPAVGYHLPRRVPASGAIICGVYIPPGYRIGINPAVVQHDTDVFGADAGQFNPERWMVDDTSHMEKAMLVFGAKVGGCLGQDLALCQIYKVVPYILRNFDISLDPARAYHTQNYWYNRVSVGVDFKTRVFSKMGDPM
ncbi:cytochrome P450 [Aspergillus californicus]